MKKIKQNSAITLIALVITIIVLLILAAVTLNMVLGENGIFEKSRFSKEKAEYVSAKEILDLKLLDIQAECKRMNKEYTIEEIANQLGLTTEETVQIITYYEKTANIKENLNKPEEISGFVVKILKYPQINFLIGNKDELNTGIIGVSISENDILNKEEFEDIRLFENKYGIASNNNNNNNNNNYEGPKGNINIGQTAVGENKEFASDGKLAVIPEGYTISGIDGENSISGGLVIYDLQGNTISNWNEDVNNIKESYDQFVWIPVDDYDEFIEDEDYSSDSYQDNTSEENYLNMLKSIQQYKGFYIGRYESGKDYKSRRNKPLFIKASKTSAINKCLSYEYDEDVIIPSLMYGIQHDAVLRYIHNTNSELDFDNSTTYGNYRGYSITYTGLRCSSYNSNSWKDYTNYTETYGLLASGIVEEYNLSNIYDFAGNIIEITQEGSGVGRGRRP